MTNEEAWLAKDVFVERMGAAAGVMVDAIEPIRMKSRTEWIVGTQAAPNYRGVAAALESWERGRLARMAADTAGETPALPGLIDNLLNNGADNIDVLFVTDPNFSERPKDPPVLPTLRQPKFL